MKLTSDTFQEYALVNYHNPDCSSIDDFKTDLKRIYRLERCLFQYKHTGQFNDRLALNHIIILSNVFDLSIMKELLFFKLDIRVINEAGTLLYYLNYIDDNEIKIRDINIDDILLVKLESI